MLRRPILVGGVGLSFGLWMLQNVHHSMMQAGEFGLVGVMALGAGMWFLQGRLPKTVQFGIDAESIDRETVEKAIAQTELVITQLEAESQPDAKWRNHLTQLSSELDREALTIAVTGGKGVGKTALINVLSNKIAQSESKIYFQETAALFIGSDAGITEEITAKAEVLAADLALFLVTADLTETEFKTLQEFVTASQRPILVFNKQDRYLPDDRAAVLQQIKSRIKGLLPEENLVAISASPSPIKVRQQQSDGLLKEWIETPQAEITQVAQLLTEKTTKQRQQLVWATTMRKAMLLKGEVRTVLNEVRRDRALPLIEQYQWIAAATAFANPVPALDLLATAAINAQLVTDLGNIYQQKFSLQQAQSAAGTLGTLMLKLGLVELSTQTITGVLKSNAITYVAGGVVQGVSAAYLTRIAGISLIEYFQEASFSEESGQTFNVEKLSQTIQNVFQQNQRIAFLQSFVKQTINILPKTTQPEIVGGASIVN